MRYGHPAYDDWEKRRLTVSSGPTHLTILSTERCNLSCFMCSHNYIRETPVSISAGMLSPWLEKAQRVFLAGGEPLWMGDTVNRAAKDIFESMVHTHRHLKMNAYTNGILLDERTAERVLERFESIHFSVDSVDPAVYGRVRGKPLLHAVLKNMERLAAMKRQRGLKPPDHPHINMNTIVMRSTVEGLPAVAHTLARLGGHKHCLVKLRDTIGPDHGKAVTDALKKNRTPDTEANRAAALAVIAANQAQISGELFSPEILPREKYGAIVGELERIYADAGIEVEDQGNFLGGAAPKPLPGGADAVCPAPWVTADIREDGDVYCCCAHTDVLGNVRTRSFDEIWNGEKIKSVRAAFIRGEMAGCIQSGCPSVYDHFRVHEGSFSAPLLENLAREWNGAEGPRSVVLLRTAPDYQSRLAAQTILKAFPGAKLTVVTTNAGEASCRAWGIKDLDILAYPEAVFTPQTFSGWWKPKNGGYAIAAALYNREERAGYEAVESIIRSLDATRKIGLMPSGTVVSL